MIAGELRKENKTHFLRHMFQFKLVDAYYENEIFWMFCIEWPLQFFCTCTSDQILLKQHNEGFLP